MSYRSEHSDRPGSVYKRCETDLEFRARLLADRCYTHPNLSGKDLDDNVWLFFKRQRRIIEVSTP